MFEPKAVHHVAGEEDGETVGWDYIVNATQHVWCGEISRRTFEEHGLAEPLGTDLGWFILIYDDGMPSGEQAIVVGKAPDEERARIAARLIAIGMFHSQDC